MGEVNHQRSCQSPGSTDSSARRPTVATTRGLTAATTRTDASIGNVHCFLLALATTLALLITGCTPCREYFRNGFKVGPNYGRPPAPVAEHWIDASDQRVHSVGDDDCHWWTVFNDPVLSELVQTAYRQNLTLREAGFRILEARAERGIAVGEMFPQLQEANGGYNRTGVSENVANRVATPQRFFSTWTFGFAMDWELDFWGRFRRAVESADAQLDASVENYDDVLVTLIADVATNYVEIRTSARQLAFANQSLTLFRQILSIPEAYYKQDTKTRIPYDLARANVAQAEALVAQLEIVNRQAENRLCILLGMPVQDLRQALGEAPIPTTPTDVVVGIPADLLRRRPDVRKAERLAAAQSAQIGIAESEFYPHITLLGTLGWSSQDLTTLFEEPSFRGTVGPQFRWNILNYGRIVNGVRVEDAKFQESIANYQQTVLKADGEVENALIWFLKSQTRAQALGVSADAWRDGVDLTFAQYKGGLIEFLPVGYFSQNLLLQQNDAIMAQGDVAKALIDVYRALGGGWQIRLGAGAMPVALPPPEWHPPEEIPSPADSKK
jgi:NodT family efflux transporter outer membrane factor (OMF) lipoprotein